MDLVPSIFTGIAALLNLLSKVEARNCPTQSPGQGATHHCPRGQYCCGQECCPSPTFQFTQLWYYWLMVIFMLIICSGGQWWYRYWISSRYLLGTTSHNATLNSFGEPGGGILRSTTHRLNPQLSSVSPPTRVLYRPSSHGHSSAIVLEPYWKPWRIAPPAYSSSVPPPKPYGPPPSYDSVVGLSELGLPASPESPRESTPQLSPSFAEGLPSSNDDRTQPVTPHQHPPDTQHNTPGPQV